MIGDSMETSYGIWPTLAQFKALVAQHQGWWVTDSETDGLAVLGPDSRDKAWIVGLNPLGTGAMLFFDCQDPEWPQCKEIIEGLDLAGHNLRFDVHAMNLEPRGKLLDTMLCQYHINTVGKKSLDDLAPRHRRRKLPTIPELKGPKGEQNDIRLLRQGNKHWAPHLLEYLADDVHFTAFLAQWYIDRRQVHTLDGQVEKVVQRMEDRGVRLLTDRLEALAQRIKPLVSHNEAVIRAAGFSGNLNSSPQLAEFLSARKYPFKVWEWNKTKRRRERKFSTNSKTVLEPYFDKTGDELIGALMMYRAWNKKHKDFCLTLPTFVQADGLVHGTIKTARTATGRFAHATPNLGQIPKQGKTDLEREVAKAFRACFQGASGWTSGADYSQVELRVAAALSGDARMLEAFASGEDPHASTAAATSGHSVDNLPDGERFKAKATNFGILNGMGAGRLAIGIKTTADEAQRFIDKHRRAHPELHDWMAGVTLDANYSRMVEGIDGTALSYTPADGDVNNAVSMMVQGGAAVLMKHGLVACEEAGLRPILSVHDEVVGDCKDKGDEYAEVMQEAANNAFPELLGAVDFKATGGAGETWAAV